MNTQAKIQGPVVIGGVGGSGTRIVAAVLQQLGFYLGPSLNPANDNNWFTLLFNRPKWYARHLSNPEEICRGLAIFEKAMRNGRVGGADSLAFLAEACRDFSFPKRRLFSTVGKHSGVREGLFALRSAASMLLPKRIHWADFSGWGWKEPNTHIYMEHLSHFFKDMKFIQVIRHGLDMAYSSNQRQLYLWGSFFNLEIPESRGGVPQASLKYWIAANQRAVELGRRLLGNRFLLLNFDRLCLAPEEGMKQLLDFLAFKPEEVPFEALCGLPRLPSSASRYLRHEPGTFSQEEIAQVRALGFEVKSSKPRS